MKKERGAETETGRRGDIVMMMKLLKLASDGSCDCGNCGGAAAR